MEERGLSTEVVNEEGCVRLEPSPAPFDCGAPVVPAASGSSPPTDPDANKTLRGFSGPYYETVDMTGQLVVLENTVAVPASGPWQATGLVRNETRSVIGEVTVMASLRAADEQELARALAASPVAPVRPGEPVPFELTADVDVAAVDHVVWEASATAPGDPRTRHTEVYVHWTVPYGDREQLVDDTGPPPFPYIMAGSVESLADIPISAPAVVVGWLTEEGRVRHVETRPLEEVGTREILDVLPERISADETGIADFTIMVDDPEIAPHLHSSTYMYWVGTGAQE